MRSTRRPWLLATSVGLGLLLCGAAVWPSLRTAHVGGVGKGLAWTVSAAAAVVVGEVLCRALRLAAIGAATGHGISLPAALRITLVGDFAAAVTPANSGGEPARLLALSGEGLPWGHAALVLGLEFAIDKTLLGAILVGLLAGRGLPSPGTLPLPSLWLASGGVAALAAVAIGRAPGLPSRLRSLASEARAAAGVLRRRKGQAALGLLAGAGHCALRFSVLPVIAAGLAVHVDLRALVLWQVLAFYGLAFTPVPGGAGATEAAFLLFFRTLVPPSQLGLLLAVWRFSSYHIYILSGWLGTWWHASRALPQGSPRPSEPQRA